MRWWKVTLATPKKKKKKAAYFITRVAKGLPQVISILDTEQTNDYIEHTNKPYMASITSLKGTPPY